jgi:hypothetical protein
MKGKHDSHENTMEVKKRGDGRCITREGEKGDVKMTR